MESVYECPKHGKNHDDFVIQSSDKSVIIFCSQCYIDSLINEVGYLHRTVAEKRNENE